MGASRLNLSGRRRRSVRQRVPDFCFMAEVYWDLEWTLQQQGFDYTYDKRLYDRLHAGQARPVREHFHAGLEYQNKLARFLENHDEPRAAAAFSLDVHKAAAVITFLSPGLRFFHQGQGEGRQNASRRICAAAQTNLSTSSWHNSTTGCWLCSAIRPYARATGNCSHAFPPGTATGPGIVSWPLPARSRCRAAAGDGELCPNQSQCYVPAAIHGPWLGSQWRLQDMLGDATYDREGNDLHARGLYLDAPPWQAASVFALRQHG